MATYNDKFKTVIVHTMLTDEECDNYIELTEENATEFFTALNNAVCHKMTKTGMAENFLTAQHVYNQLLVQYLLKSDAPIIDD